MKWVLILITAIYYNCNAQSVSVSFDDPMVSETPVFTWQKRNQEILTALAKHNITSTLFVCGHRVNNVNGKALVASWNKAGHEIANHSWSHKYYNSSKWSFDFLKGDFLRCDSLIKNYSNYTKRFRFPYLKEGETQEKRDSMRVFMKETGYTNGYVSIDASDWYFDARLIDTLKKNPLADITPFREAYIAHIVDRCNYYDSLSTALTGRQVHHVLLLHHNLLNALFLDALLRELEKQKWQLENTKQAYTDAIYTKMPNIVPAGESIIWSLAKESDRFEKVLRYPAEDGEYEKKQLNAYLKQETQRKK
ncbi:MAG TPA: polysaccharide deacetylase family protein [Flavobacteriales bacterium]|nr:polysaccharide deacetylase family protein [Flavobacteriales bacterium]